MTDKAVSTEDLVLELPRNASLDAARLEAVIKTLVENKVESLKNEKRKSSSITSSPKSLINRLRITSTSTASSKDKDELTVHSHKETAKSKEHQKTEKIGHSSPRKTKTHHAKVHNSGRLPQFNSENGNENYNFLLQRGFCQDQHCTAMLDCMETCYCKRETNGEIRMRFDDDYISLKIDEFDELDETNQRHLRRMERKRRRRRKRRMKRLPPITVPVHNDSFKEIDPDELSKRARWTIVITACLLLFMCLLLVGITLRMAPIIDDMVRKENEELMNSMSEDFSQHHSSLHNSTTSVPTHL